MATATPGQVESKRGTPSPSASLVGPNRRPAYCPLCGQPRADVLANDVRRVEDALCSGRCDTAWHAIEALRERESSSVRVATRKRLEYASQQPHPPALSELLLLRWRAGDWTVAPERLLAQVAADREAASGHDPPARA
jgi:hypothetical protein